MCLLTRQSQIVFPCRTCRLPRGVDSSVKLGTRLATLRFVEVLAQRGPILFRFLNPNVRVLLLVVLFVITWRRDSQWLLSGLAGLASSLISLALLSPARELTEGCRLTALLLLTGALGRTRWVTTYSRQDRSCGVVSAEPWLPLGTMLVIFELGALAPLLPLLSLLVKRSPSLKA